MTEGRPRPRIARSHLPWRLRLLADPAARRHAAAVVVLAALLATVVGRSLSSADEARRRWGELRTVIVAAHDLDPGDALAGGAIRAVRWPAAVVPADALERPPPGGSRAASPLVAGLALTDLAVLEPGEQVDDRRTIALPLGAAALPVQVGDRVDVWAVTDPAAVIDGAERAERVARGAEVVEADAGTVVVAVAPGEAEATAAASAGAQTVLVGST